MQLTRGTVDFWDIVRRASENIPGLILWSPISHAMLAISRGTGARLRRVNEPGPHVEPWWGKLGRSNKV